MRRKSRGRQFYQRRSSPAAIGQSLVKAAMDYLEYAGYHPARINPTRFLYRAPEKRWVPGKTRPSQVGLQDIWVCKPPDGRLYVIECKAGFGRFSKEQRQWKEDVTNDGAHHITLGDVRDLELYFPMKHTRGNSQHEST